MCKMVEKVQFLFCSAMSSTQNESNRHRLIIMRGASGSGKSTLAQSLAAAEPHALILSTDDFWRDVDGAYNFNPSALSKAHYWNQERVRVAMENGACATLWWNERN